LQLLMMQVPASDVDQGPHRHDRAQPIPTAPFY
jgi:hypothetical protein